MKKSSRNSGPKVLVTGRLWLGADGARSIGSALVDLINEARQEIIIVAYRLTVAVPDLMQSLESALSRGCLARIVRDVSGEPVPAEENYLKKLVTEFDTLSLWDFRDTSKSTSPALHAKMVIVDRTHAILGSANFSRNGMLENHEIAVKLEGSEASSLATACDKLIENGRIEGVLIQRGKDDA